MRTVPREHKRDREREQYAEAARPPVCAAECGTPAPDVHARVLRPVRQERRQTLKKKGEELSSILHLIILSDGKPGHRMSF